MSTANRLARIIAGALLSGGVAVVGVVLAPGAAQAICDPICGNRWCPGQRLPNSSEPITWDQRVCHDWYYAPGPGSHVIEGVPAPGPGATGFPWP
jgi:hypothetical protein